MRKDGNKTNHLGLETRCLRGDGAGSSRLANPGSVSAGLTKVLSYLGADPPPPRTQVTSSRKPKGGFCGWAEVGPWEGRTDTQSRDSSELGPIRLWKLSYPEHCLLCCVNDARLSGSYRPKSSWGTNNPGVHIHGLSTQLCRYSIPDTAKDPSSGSCRSDGSTEPAMALSTTGCG